MHNSCARWYYRQVKKELACPYRLKRKILRALRSDLEDFIEANLLADTRDINAHFGTPEAYTEHYHVSLHPEEIYESVRFHTRVKQIICVISTLILLLAMGGYAKIITDRRNETSYVWATPPYDPATSEFYIPHN